MRSHLGLAAACALRLSSAVAVPAMDDPFIGTWVLDPYRSHYEGEQRPDSMVIVITATAEGIHYRSDSRRSESDQWVSCEYTADYDGRPAMVRGSAGLMAPVALKRVDATTVEATYMRGLQVTASSRRVLSENAQVMTISTTWRGADGESHTNVAVFERSVSSGNASTVTKPVQLNLGSRGH